MVAMDRHELDRLVLAAAILVLVVMGAVREESYPVWRVTILAPALFLAAAVFLLGLPYLAMEHAEGERVRWRRALHFIGHNWILPLAGLMVLAAVVVVSYVSLDSMTTPEKAIFFAATVVGLAATLREWFLDLLPDRKT
jgi:hypothetical protein